MLTIPGIQDVGLVLLGYLWAFHEGMITLPAEEASMVFHQDLLEDGAERPAVLRVNVGDVPAVVRCAVLCQIDGPLVHTLH